MKEREVAGGAGRREGREDRGGGHIQRVSGARTFVRSWPRSDSACTTRANPPTKRLLCLWKPVALNTTHSSYAAAARRALEKGKVSPAYAPKTYHAASDGRQIPAFSYAPQIPFSYRNGTKRRYNHDQARQVSRATNHSREMTT